MSSVRMCDRCSAVFSEREDGWSSQNAEINVRDPESGRMFTREVQMDSCAACTAIMVGKAQRPMIMPENRVNAQYEEGS